MIYSYFPYSPLISVYFLLSTLYSIAFVLGQDNPPARFFLVSSTNASMRTELINDFSDIDVSVMTIVATHGWNSDINVPFLTVIPEEFQARERCNCILVDWHEIASQFYVGEQTKTKLVGSYVGDFLLQLKQTIGLRFDLVHLISHSLGAHVCGFTGQRVKARGQIIGRITGLDPANPAFPTFGMNNEDHRLSKHDAVTVVVVHSDGLVLGIFDPIGTVDFYPNCGTLVQPPCRSIDFGDILGTLICSHGASVRYFVESIRSRLFIGKKCARSFCFFNTCNSMDTAILGPDTPAETRGIYHFSTNKYPPYARGKNGLK